MGSSRVSMLKEKSKDKILAKNNSDRYLKTLLSDSFRIQYYSN